MLRLECPLPGLAQEFNLLQKRAPGLDRLVVPGSLVDGPFVLLSSV